MISLSSPRMWGSEAALLDHLNSFNGRGLLIGRDAEAPREFYSFSISCNGDSCEVGVISFGPGTKPGIAVTEERGRAIVGHDSAITWIDLRAATALSTLRMFGVFYHFLTLANSEDILVVNELGVVRVNADGAERWGVSTDILQRAEIDSQGRLAITLMDPPSTLLVSVQTGERCEFPSQ